MVGCLVLGGSGCGGGDDEPSGDRPAASGTATESAQTREEFIASGDEICKRVNAEVGPVNRRIADVEQKATNPQQALAGAAPILADAYELQRDHVAEFRDLTPPTGDEETVGKIVAALEQQVALVGQLAEAADAGNLERLGEVSSQLPETRSRVRGLLQGYGFEECGRGAG